MVQISGGSTSRSALRYIELFNFNSIVKVINDRGADYDFEDKKLLIP